MPLNDQLFDLTITLDFVLLANSLRIYYISQFEALSNVLWVSMIITVMRRYCYVNSLNLTSNSLSYPAYQLLRLFLFSVNVAVEVDRF